MPAFSVLDAPLNGANLVEASAGTGKTFAITTLYLRLLLERAHEVEQILVVTFTEAATAELQLRIRRRLKEAAVLCRALARNTAAHVDPVLREMLERQPDLARAEQRLHRALLSFDNAAIYTIHGFCHRVLNSQAFQSQIAFDAELLKDIRPLVDEVLADHWSSRLSEAPLELVAALSSQQFGPAKFSARRFASFVATAAQLRIVPSTSTTPPPPLDTGHLHERYERLRQLYDASEVRQLLLNASLGTKYPKRWVPRWCEDLKVQLQYAPELFPLNTTIAVKFTTASLREACTSASFPEHPFFNAFDAFIEEATRLQQQVLQHVLYFRRDLVDYVRSELSRRKRARSLLSFDDLLTQLCRALEHSQLVATLRKHYPSALIDEFQDTDPVQYEIFQKIYDGSPGTLFLIGDPKQAIYSFRGADVFAYFHAAERVEVERRYTMGVNYRSDPPLVNAVNQLFQSCPAPFLFDELTYPEVRPGDTVRSSLTIDTQPASGLTFGFLPRRPGESHDSKTLRLLLPRLVASRIRWLLATAQIAERPLQPGDIAILTRTNREAFNYQRALQKLHIPCVVLGDRSVYEQREARELQLFLAAVLEPGNARTLRAALTTEMLGVLASELYHLEDDIDGWDGWVERFRSWHQRWASNGFVQMMRQWLDDCGVIERLLRRFDGERRVTNLLHLIELLHTEASRSHLGPSGVLQYLARQRQQENMAQESEQIRLESDDDAVTLTTIHKSKGLEYPVVFCPTLYNSSLGHSGDSTIIKYHDRVTRDLCLDIGSDEQEAHRERMRQETLAENLRLLYVALTRAKHRCEVLWGAFSGWECSALAYLLHHEQLAAPPAFETKTLKQLKQLSDLEMCARLNELAKQSTGITVEQLERDPTVVPYEPHHAIPGQLEARHVTQRLRAWSRTASFSEIASSGNHPASTTWGKDLDERTAIDTSPTIPLETTPSELHAQVTLAGFPGGIRTGNFFHAILEHLDFTAPLPQDVIAEALRAHGFEAELAPIATAGLEQLLRTPVLEGFSLGMLSSNSRISEMEFLIPVDGTADAALDSGRLASAFETDALPRFRDYGAQLRRLRFNQLRGFLKGFIDLVFRHDGKWYVVDYKTNWLGEHYADYRDGQLWQAMAESHYILQYHLYGLAIHRYLRRRVSDYDYDKHFGGVLYLFIRGMHPELDRQTGTFYERPPRGRIEALDGLFRSPRVDAPSPGVEP